MTDRGTANSPRLIGFNIWVTLSLSLRYKLRFVLKLSIDDKDDSMVTLINRSTSTVGAA